MWILLLACSSPDRAAIAEPTPLSASEAERAEHVWDVFADPTTAPNGEALYDLATGLLVPTIAEQLAALGLDQGVDWTTTVVEVWVTYEDGVVFRGYQRWDSGTLTHDDPAAVPDVGGSRLLIGVNADRVRVRAQVRASSLLEATAEDDGAEDDDADEARAVERADAVEDAQASSERDTGEFDHPEPLEDDEWSDPQIDGGVGKYICTLEGVDGPRRCGRMLVVETHPGVIEERWILRGGVLPANFSLALPEVVARSLDTQEQRDDFDRAMSESSPSLSNRWVHLAEIVAGDTNRQNALTRGDCPDASLRYTRPIVRPGSAERSFVSTDAGAESTTDKGADAATDPVAALGSSGSAGTTAVRSPPSDNTGVWALSFVHGDGAVEPIGWWERKSSGGAALDFWWRHPANPNTTIHIEGEDRVMFNYE